MVPLAAFLTFISVLLLARAFGTRETDPLRLRVDAIRSGIRPREAIMERPFVERAMVPVLTGFAGLLLKLLPVTWVQATSRRLIWADSRLSITGFVLLWALCAASLPLIVLFMADAVGRGGLLVVGLAAGGLGLGFVLPQIFLTMQINDRHYRARKQLPDALDLMTTAVEAGLSLDAALSRVATYQTGPLQKELTRALQEMSLGKSRREALTDMSGRLNLPELVAFVQSLNQAEITGAPIGQVLRVQAEQVRIKRRQAAEAQAQRAPLYMVFAVIIFILPSLFLLILGALGLTVIDLLSNSEVF